MSSGTSPLGSLDVVVDPLELHQRFEKDLPLPPRSINGDRRQPMATAKSTHKLAYRNSGFQPDGEDDGDEDLCRDEEEPIFSILQYSPSSYHGDQVKPQE